LKVEDVAKLVKTIVRPIIIIMLTGGWIGFIASHTAVPIGYESTAISIISEYVLERGYKRVKEIKKK